MLKIFLEIIIKLTAGTLSRRRLITVLIMVQTKLQSVHTEQPSWMNRAAVSAPVTLQGSPGRDSLAEPVLDRALTFPATMCT